MRRESWESQRDAGRFNPASVLIYRESHGRGKSRRECVHRLVLGKGDGDDFAFFRDGRYLLALSWRTGLDYVGLQVYSLDDGEECGEDVFCQGEEHYREVLGPMGLELTPANMARRLFGYWSECHC